MKLITVQKPFSEIEELLGKAKSIFLIGCGTCATLCKTGGVSEVIAMKETLNKSGRKVTGWVVIPVACDELTSEALLEHNREIKQADSLVVLTCAFGVQTVSDYSDKPVLPALNTLFIGKDKGFGHFMELCIQCGECVIGKTAGICPLTRCAKGLLNGPCGGTNAGKCEVDPSKDCAWVLIYERLKSLGQLDQMKEILTPKDFSKATTPRTLKLEGREGVKVEVS
jgi:ferredoxin